jgi:photosystem II stability/assembly factor-like uncharacterized protein
MAVLAGLLLWTALPFPADPALLAATTPQPTTQSLNTWSSHGPWGAYVSNLAIAPSNPQIVYAWTPTDLFKSSDGGTSWSHAAQTEYYAKYIAIDTFNPQTLYYLNHARRAFKSTDGGANWNDIAPPETPVVALAMDPANPTTLYSLDQEFRLSKSTDGGATWNRTGNGLPKLSRRSRSGYGEYVALAVSPDNSNTLFAASPEKKVGKQGLYRSVDGGANWSKVGTGPFSDVPILQLVVAQTAPNVLYARTSEGWFRSTDGGAEWSAFSSPDATVVSLAIDPRNAATIYLGTADGSVLKSDDAGASWNEANVGLHRPSSINTLVIDPRDPANLYLGTGSGVFKSSDGGGGWQDASFGLGKNIYFVAAPGTSAVIAGGWGPGTFLTADGGENWERASLPDFYQFATDPRHPNLVYAFSGSERLLYTSTDAGATWRTVPAESLGEGVSSMAIDPGDSNTLYASTYYEGLQKSTDGGSTWTYIGYIYLDILVIHPSNPNTLYGTFGCGDWDYYCNVLVRSTDGGVNWNQSPADQFPSMNSWIQSLAVDPYNPEILHAALSDGNVIKSINGGDTWQLNFTPSQREGYDKNNLVIDPTNPDTLYVGYGSGVYRSTDGGASWGEFNDGLLPGIRIQTLAIDPFGTSLHVGTNIGVFDYHFPAPCARTLSPAQQPFDAGGGAGIVDVTAATGCDWMAESKADWIRITSESSSAGNGAVSYSVAPNEGTARRIGSIAIGVRVLRIIQAGLPVRINSATVSGKDLLVSGENFDPGAVILLNGATLITSNDPQNPKANLIAKKVRKNAGKKVKPGDTLQVRNPNGTFSQEFIFTGS